MQLGRSNSRIRRNRYWLGTVLQRLFALALFGVFTVGSAMAQNSSVDLSSLGTAQRMDYLYAISQLDIEETLLLASDPANRPFFTGNAGFRQCTMNLINYSRLLSGEVTDTKELEEIAAQHGFNVDINQTMYMATVDYKATVNQLAGIAALVDSADKYAPNQLRSTPFFQMMKQNNVHTNQSFGIAMGEMAPLMGQTMQTIRAQLIDKMMSQARLVTQRVCLFN